MDVTFACIAGEEIYRQWDTVRLSGDRIAPRATPFGPSGEMFLVADAQSPFYLLPRHGAGLRKIPPRKVNSRANLYALKDLGVRCILAWGPGGAITHNVAVGDLAVLSDVIDRTYEREKTFFEDSPLGFLRQFPVFCPALREVVLDVLTELKLPVCDGGTAVVSEGPRLETPAEIRMLAHVGAEFATHTFVPEVFLAKELSLCYAAICYVVNYAETGSRQKPFAPGSLFGGLVQKTDAERLARTASAMGDIVHGVAGAVAQGLKRCECGETMAAHVAEHGLSGDWRQWFSRAD